jgi:hypothetical protein
MKFRTKAIRPQNSLKSTWHKCKGEVSRKAGQDADENLDADITLHLHIDISQNTVHVLFRLYAFSTIPLILRWKKRCS